MVRASMESSLLERKASDRLPFVCALLLVYSLCICIVVRINFKRVLQVNGKQTS